MKAKSDTSVVEGRKSFVTKPRVLVVEDDPFISVVIRHFLEKSDYSVACMVTSGEQAIEAAGESKPDVVLMDVQLAGEMDGVEAAGLIWNQFHIPVVYLTGDDDEETISRAASTEAYGYLHKPVQERELASTLQIAIQKHVSERRVREHERWLETILRSVADAVIAADSIGCVKLVNPAAEALTGWKQEEAVGLDLLDVFHVLECDSRQPAECAVLQVIREGAVGGAGRTRVLVARDGSETLIEESAAPIVNDSGHMLGVVLVFRPGVVRGSEFAPVG
jgi:PAS domain S-box-containing protein